MWLFVKKKLPLHFVSAEIGFVKKGTTLNIQTTQVSRWQPPSLAIFSPRRTA
jgi:hypothetical protein